MWIITGWLMYCHLHAVIYLVKLKVRWCTNGLFWIIENTYFKTKFVGQNTKWKEEKNAICSGTEIFNAGEKVGQIHQGRIYLICEEAPKTFPCHWKTRVCLHWLKWITKLTRRTHTDDNVYGYEMGEEMRAENKRSQVGCFAALMCESDGRNRPCPPRPSCSSSNRASKSCHH